MTPLNFVASASAKADLPLPVAPTTAMTFGRVLGFDRVCLVERAAVIFFTQLRDQIC